MAKIEKIEQEIQSLSRDELAAFREWFYEYDSEEWDRRIEADSRSGKLDKLARGRRVAQAWRNQGTVRRFASPDFWELYRQLPADTRELADKNFELLKSDSRHPSLHFKRIGKYRSARVGLRHRALAVEIPEGLLWFWIGSHSDYDKLLG